MNINTFMQLRDLVAAQENDRLVHVEDHANRTEHVGIPRGFTTSGKRITGYRVTTAPLGIELFLSVDDGFYVHGSYGREHMQALLDVVYGS